MKRFVFVCWIISILAGLFAGCGNNTQGEASALQSISEIAEVSAEEGSFVMQEPSSAQSVEEDEAVPTAIISYPVGNGETYTIALVADGNLVGFIPEGDPANCGALRMMQDVTGINLDYTVFAMASENMTLMLASGDWMDIICRIDETTTYSIQTALEEEIILDLAPYIDEYAPDYAAAVNSSELFLKECYTEKGQMGEFNEFRQPTITGMCIRMDWLREAGIEKVPETYEELEEACIAVKANHGDIPGCIPMAGSLISECYETEFRYGYGFNSDFYNDEDRNVQFAWTSDNGRAYLEMLARWVEEGIVTRDEMLTGDVQDMRSRVYVGQSLVQNGNSEMFSQSFMSMVEDEEFELVPMNYPKINADDVLRVNSAEPSVYAGWSISTTCENPELLVQAVNWLYTEEGTIAMNFGTENESYIVDENGDYKFTDLVLNNPNGIPLFFARNVYTGLDTPYIGLPELATAQMSTQQEVDAMEFWKQQPATNDAVVRGTLSLEETEKASGYADISTFVQQRLLQFVMGDMKITDDTWNSFVAEVENMGIADVLACYQAAQDRYDAK